MKLSSTKVSGEVFNALVDEVRACTVCAAHLPSGPRPVLQVYPAARLLIAGQASGSKVQSRLMRTSWGSPSSGMLDGSLIASRVPALSEFQREWLLRGGPFVRLNPLTDQVSSCLLSPTHQRP